MTWPKLPKPHDNNVCTGWCTHGDPVPMHARGRSGAEPGWESRGTEPTVCKHGLGSCEECGTTNRRDAVHTTKGGKGTVGRIRR
jgi:hypothetical protein